MKRFSYREWEVYVFREDIGGVPMFFAVSWESQDVRISFDSYWDAFSKLRTVLDKIDGLIALDSDSPF